jgi:RHS repeat-associated protein
MTNSTRVERRRLRARRVLLAVSTILCSGVALPVLAQTASPSHRNLDANGVDLTLGDFVMNFPEGSIGSGSARLSLNRTSAGGMASQWDNYGFRLIRSGSTITVTIFRPDFSSDTFTMPAFGDTTVSNPNGTSLTRDSNPPAFIYTTSDGTAVTFDNPNYDVDPPDTYYCNMSALTSGCAMLPDTITSPDGNIVSLLFDAPVGSAPKLVTITNFFGYSIDFTYSGYNRTRADFKTNGTVQGSVSYSYPSAGTVDVTDMAGNVWELTSTSIKRPGETSPSFVIGGTPSAVTSATRDGVVTTYARTVSGSTGTMVATDALSHATTIVSNLTIGRPTSVTDANLKVTSYGYDSSGRLTTITQPEGNYVQYTLDGRGNAIQTQYFGKSGSPTPALTYTAAYDTTCSNALTCNQPNSVTTPLGNTTNYSYDGTTGQVTKVTLPAATTGATRPETRYSYTATGGGYLLTGASQCQSGAAPSCVGTADEVKTTIVNDAQGNVTSISNGAGDGSLTATTTMTYSAKGDLLTSGGPLSGTTDTTTYRYDAARRQVGVIYPDPDGAGPLKQRAIKTTYDSAGRATEVELGTVVGTTDPNWAAFTSARQQVTTYTNNRVSNVALTAGGTTYAVSQYSYDADGRSDCVATRMNSTAWGTATPACSLQTTGSAGQDRITKTEYDPVGRVNKTTSAYATTSPSVDAFAIYSDNGKMATLTDANGNKTTYGYDRFDRFVKTQYPSPTTPGSSSTTDYEELAYDDDNRIISRHLRGYAGDSTQHIDYSYDALNRVTSKDLPGSELDVTFSYDLLGRPLSAATTAQTLTFGYDALNRNVTQGGPLGTVTAAYDIAGRRTRLTWPDTFYVTYDYQVTGEQTAIRENGATSGIGVLATYAYDDLGRRISLTRGNGTTTSYTPDAVSRLSSLTHDLAGTTNDLTLGFSYNPASQIAGTTRSNDLYAWTGAANRNDASSLNGLNQITTVGTGSLGYDARGNLTSTGSNSYTYSSENLLLTGPSSASLTYDPVMRLYQESGASVAATRFQYDGQAMIGEFDSSGVLQKRYVHGPSTDEPLVEYDKSGGSFTRAWLHADERGSIVAQSSDTGAATAANAYDEYGVPGASNTGRFGYTGQTWLPSLGLWYYKARMYSGRLGRFLQTDPIGYDDGISWYGYAQGDPINFYDPSGLAGIICKDGTAFTEAQTKDGGGESKLCASHGGPDELTVTANPIGGGGGAGGTVSGGVAAQPENPQVACTGYAYVMQGNPKFLTSPHHGAFGSLITPNSVAVIPRQWSGTAQWNSSYRYFGPGTFGFASSADGRKSLSFSGITDVVDNRAIAPNALAAQDKIMSRAPGELVLEVTGGADLGKAAKVFLFTDNPHGCPAGTSQYTGN